MITVREAHEKDAPAVQAVIRAVYDEYGWPWEPEGYHADLYELEGAYWSEGDAFFIAERDGVAAGTIALEDHVGGLTEPGGLVRILGCDGSLERLYVHPHHRRAGIGEILVDHVIAAARVRGMRRLEIWSDQRLHASHALYEKKGARRVGERLCDDPDLSPEFGYLLTI